MLVYGDVERLEDAEAKRLALIARVRALAVEPPGPERHGNLVGAFIATAELVQATIDAEFAVRQVDEAEAGAEGLALLTRLAALAVRSWDSPNDPLDGVGDIAGALGQLALPTQVQTKLAEGYAFYALYPESYIEAARRSGLSGNTRVIGIRSIGAGLAAVVAAALGAAPPVTVRPVGHPFARRIAASDQLADHVLAGNPAAFAVVDEGPGLSGSSFGAVADWLEGLGVSPGRIHVFPSHSGAPGPQASPAHRQRWASAARHHVRFEDLLLDAAEPSHRLERWVADLVGPLDEPLMNVSGGGWRGVAGVGEVPIAPGWERRKFLATSSGIRWLVKFAALGAEGERKLALAQELATAGFGPPVAGLCHGFLVERWVEGTNLTEAHIYRDRLVPQLGAYLGFRATLTAPADAGASPGKLAEMAVYNTREALGVSAAATLERRLAGLEDLEALVTRVEVDARLHRWEWVVTPDGRLLKTDALDHARAHDFIGAQDIAWDVAGVIVEHDLTEVEAQRVCRIVVERSGRAVSPELIRVLLPCYIAFQLGAWTMSSGADAPITRRYAGLLSALLTSSPAL